MSQEKIDILVIGGGIVGTSLARELQSQGRQVLLIERGGIAAGCSFGNAGWVTPCFAMPLPQPGMFWKSIGWLLDPESPLRIKPEFSWALARWLMHFMGAMNQKQMEASVKVLAQLSQYSLDFYEKMARSPNHAIAFERRGLLMVSANQAGLGHAEMELELMQKQGISGRKLAQDELLHLEPALKPVVRGGVLFDQEAQVEPYPTTLAMHQAFLEAGGRSLLQTEVYDFKRTGDVITEVMSTQGNFRPDLVIMAAGSWSPALGRALGVNIPVLGGKGYSMIVPAPEHKPQRPIMIVERKIAVTPRANSVRIAGTLELVNQDFSISPNRLRAIQRGADEYLKMDCQETASEIWRGLRPCTPDGVPMVGFSSRIKNLFYCTGHQLLGLQSAPGTARLSRDLITGKTPIVDPHPFRAERFE